MINKILRQTDNVEDWNKIRDDILKRIIDTIGFSYENISKSKPMFEILETYTKYGLKHILIKYHILDECWNKAVIVLPENISSPTPCVLAIHGTTKAGKYTMIDPEKNPHRAYGIELARRGFVTCQYDLYGFGEYDYDMFKDNSAQDFFKKYPKWSLDGRRLLDGQRIMDILNTFDYIQTDKFGVIGNSLGGRSVIYLTALDNRIKCAVSSTGISPNATNVFRSLKHDYYLSPKLSDTIMTTGKASWEYQELLAIIAPRALLALEPYNDTCNTDSFSAIECLYQASDVFRLLDCPDHLAWYTHGDGHDTVDSVREFAYLWLERFLKS